MQQTYAAILEGRSRTMTVKSWIVLLKDYAIFEHYGRTKILDLLKHRHETGYTVSSCLGITPIYNADNPNPRKTRQDFTSKLEQKQYDKINPLMRRMYLAID